ncbi:hypothetical protein AB1L88_09385 [Tautonia sp. JC769]|uniref:hypothetical protein n=1 Tax=Tautonia sp. JC769 TaxID=3232135 RepID=UPI003459736E
MQPEVPQPPPRRRFSLLDVMILVATIAPGLALARVMQEELPRNSFLRSGPFELVWNAIRYGIALATPVLLTMTPGLLVLRLFRPRRDGKRLWHSRGALNLAVLSALIPVGGFSLWLVMRLPGRPGSIQMLFLVLLLPMLLGAAAGSIAIGCKLLGLRGRSLDWIDRLGRFWGWLWIVVAFTNFWTFFWTLLH